MEEWPTSGESLASPGFVTGERMGSNACLDLEVQSVPA